MDSEWCVSTTTISPAIVHTNGYLVTINVLFPETVCHIQLYCPSDHHPPPRLSKAFFRNSAALRLAEFGIAIHLILVGSGCTFPTGIVHCAYMVPRRLNGFCTGRGVLSPSDPEGGGQLGGENPEEGGGGGQMPHYLPFEPRPPRHHPPSEPTHPPSPAMGINPPPPAPCMDATPARHLHWTRLAHADRWFHSPP